MTSNRYKRQYERSELKVEILHIYGKQHKIFRKMLTNRMENANILML